MRITTRFTLALSLAGLLLFGGFGVGLVARERSELHRAVDREVALLGSSLRVAVENALRDRQLSDVEETALRIERIDARVDVYVFDVAGANTLATGPAAAIPDLEPLVRDALATGTPELSRRPRDRHAVFATPLQGDDGEVLGALALARPLDDVQQDLAATTAAIALTVAAFVLAAAALGQVLGAAWLGRPLRRLADAMDRVRAGDLQADPRLARDDEIGAVAAAFEEMLAELREARVRLAHEAEQRDLLLGAVQRADKLATVGQLAAAVGHEIGSPLQVLLGRARALEQRPDDPERVRRNAGILVHEGDRIARIVEQLLAVARRGPRRRAGVDVAIAARRVVDLLEIEARRRRVALALRVDGPLPPVAADEDQLEQVVLNLVSNALAATPPGGRVEVEASAEVDALVLTVRDTGHGMPDEVRDRAFEPFFTTRGERGGTGLGLAVVRRILEEHGGSVQITSTGPEGTAIAARLPRGELG